MWFYYWQFDVNSTYQTVNMLPEHLHEVTRHMLRYLSGREDNLQILTTVAGQRRYFFSDIEMRHMFDVYKLFSIGYMIRDTAFLLLIVTSAVFAATWRKSLLFLFNVWRKTAFLVFIILLILIVFISINWHNAFVIFHEILFNNDDWILNPNIDLLVNIVPYDFFITLSIHIGVYFIAGLMVMYATSAVAVRRFKKSDQKTKVHPGQTGQ